MDRITKSLLDEFVSTNQLTALPEDTAFEYFCGWLIVSNHHDESLQSEDIHVGAGADCGIDCIAIIGLCIKNPNFRVLLVQLSLLYQKSKRSAQALTHKLN